MNNNMPNNFNNGSAGNKELDTRMMQGQNGSVTPSIIQGQSGDSNKPNVMQGQGGVVSIPGVSSNSTSSGSNSSSMPLQGNSGINPYTMQVEKKETSVNSGNGTVGNSQTTGAGNQGVVVPPVAHSNSLGSTPATANNLSQGVSNISPGTNNSSSFGSIPRDRKSVV